MHYPSDHRYYFHVTHCASLLPRIGHIHRRACIVAFGSSSYTMGRHDRPEHSAPPEIFYNEDEARKYTDNTRMIAIQTALTERALELLALPQDGSPKLLLDLGCGSGLSGEALTENGHVWVGFDISPAMLDVARERDVEGDVAQLDLGHGLPIRPGSFDGAISISALQWLCNAVRGERGPGSALTPCCYSH